MFTPPFLSGTPTGNVSCSTTMTTISCGIDFGTSNSSVAIATGGQAKLVPVEGDQVTTPSAMFFPASGEPVVYGRAAMKMFFERREGRLMRSLKRVLGTSLMKYGTQVNGKVQKFDKIIASFLRNLRLKTNALAQCDIEHVVMGRPVHFVDNDPEADKRAEAELKDIALQIGFKHVSFQFEPIAAAFSHEMNVAGEKLAIVADLGGGTSDFTVIRLSAGYANKTDRSSDILANTGVRVGGNDFDKDLSLSMILPEFGYGSTYGAKHLEVPLKYYHDLAEWSKVNFLYTPKNLVLARQLLHESHDKKRLGRLVSVLEHETGHSVLAVAEETKINLAAEETYQAEFTFIQDGFSMTFLRQQFEQAIQGEVDKISAAATACLRQAGVRPEQIDLVILTGGSTEIPLVQQEFKRLFPQASVADQNKLSSVGLGLAYDSGKKFG